MSKGGVVLKFSRAKINRASRSTCQASLGSYIRDASRCGNYFKYFSL